MSYTLIRLPPRKSADVTFEAVETRKPADLDSLKVQYPECFKGLSEFEGKTHLYLKEGAEPSVAPPRRFPIHHTEKAKQELDRMCDLNVIEKVTGPTDWVSNLTITVKDNGDLRMCLDPKPLNRAIRRTYHRTPRLEEITPRLCGSTVFSKLDAKHGYWGIMLDDESATLTTFTTPFGRYRFLRMPFGLNVSQDYFQEQMDRILEGCDGAIGIADDITVFGKDQAEHDRHLYQFMDRAKAHGLVLNLKKCQISQKSVKFFGNIYDKDGVHPDPDKVKALRDMPSPENPEDLRTFLGMVTHLGEFIPLLSDKTEPMRALLKKESEWQWTESHDKAFRAVTGALTEYATLAYFDKKKAITVQVDASQKGLGAVLLQEGKPILFASKALSDAETRYANIEREMLAIVFGCERFRTWVLGTEFIMESDHKPLEQIHLKKLVDTPPRLQRMLLRIQPYHITIKYRKGSEMTLADALSRLGPQPGPEIQLDKTIHSVNFSSKRLEQIQRLTREDPVLSSLRNIIAVGFPETSQELPKPLRAFWSIRDNLTVEDGFICKGERVFIPEPLRAETLKLLHEGHQGVNKTQLRARQTVFWPGIDRDIQDTVNECTPCQKYQRRNSPEPLLPHEIPTRPWRTLGADLFHWNDREYLLVCDYYSKYDIMRKMPLSVTARAVIDALKQIFSENGLPCMLITDNGPQFDCAEFTAFADEWEFCHETSSPHYPKSNGFIESHVKIVKNTLTKAKESGQDLHLALLNLRATPIDSSLPSPGELLQNRLLRTKVPSVIRNQDLQRDNVYDNLKTRQEKMKRNHDRSAQELSPLIPGQQISVLGHRDHKWHPGTVTQVCPQPRSYLVATPDGRVARRNRSHLRERVGEYISNPSRREEPVVAFRPLREPAPLVTPSVDTAPAPVPVPTPTAVPVQPTEPRRSERANKGIAPEGL